MKKVVFIVCLLLFLTPQLSEAQCAMCRAVLESEESNAAAEGINNGIVYLMAIPYLLIGGLFLFCLQKDEILILTFF